MNQQETQEYWHGLQRYNTESERHLRRGEAPTNRRQRSASSPVQHRDERTLESAGGEYEHHVGDALEGEQGGQAGEKKVNLVGRLLSTLTCRPGAVSPNDAAVPVKHDQTVGMVSIVPRKYAMAFLSRKTGRTQRNEEEEEARLRERSLGLQIPPPHEKTTRDTGNTSRIREEAQQTPRAKRGHEDKQSRSKPRVVNVGSQTPSVIGPPVDLSKMIQRAPESIRTSSPSPGSDAEPLRMNVERVPRQAHSDSSSSLSDRLRKTKLEDLPLRFGAAEEIRNLMLTLERDQNGSTNIPIQHEDRLLGGVNSTTKLHTGQANELPGGFSRPENVSQNLTQPILLFLVIPFPKLTTLISPPYPTNPASHLPPEKPYNDTSIPSAKPTGNMLSVSALPNYIRAILLYRRISAHQRYMLIRHLFHWSRVVS